MSTVRCIKTVLCNATVLVMLFPVAGLAESRPAAGVRHTLTAAYAWQGTSDLAEQGSFSVDRGVLEYRLGTRLGKRWFAGLSARCNSALRFDTWLTTAGHCSVCRYCDIQRRKTSA